MKTFSSTSKSTVIRFVCLYDDLSPLIVITREGELVSFFESRTSEIQCTNLANNDSEE